MVATCPTRSQNKTSQEHFRLQLCKRETKFGFKYPITLSDVTSIAKSYLQTPYYLEHARGTGWQYNDNGDNLPTRTPFSTSWTGFLSQEGFFKIPGFLFVESLTIGRSFVLAFLPNSSPTSGVTELYITSEYTATVNIESSHHPADTQTLSVGPGSVRQMFVVGIP